MIKNFDVLAERLKGVKIGDKEITLDLLKEALSKDEQFEIVASQVHILTDDGLNELKTTVKKSGYEEGKTAGTEMLIKEMKRKSGLDYEGKSDDQFITELTKKIEKEKGVEPNKKIQELSESVTKLQTLIEQKDSEVKTWSEKYSGLEKSTKISEVLLSKVPKNISGVTPKQFATLLQTEGYSIDFSENGEPFATLHGKPLKDQMEKHLPIDSVLTDYAKNNNWINAEGRGEGDKVGNSGNNQFKTMNDVFKYMDDNNINPMSPDGKRLQEEFEAKTQA